MRNLLGEQPERFAPHPTLSAAHAGMFFILETEASAPPAAPPPAAPPTAVPATPTRVLSLRLVSLRRTSPEQLFTRKVISPALPWSYF